MSAGTIPVDTLLKVTLDRAGAKTIQDFLDAQEKSVTGIAGAVERIGSGFEGLLRGGAGMLGIAGVGSVISQFMGSSQSGSDLALAAGRVTGGAGAWHPYGQALLQAQAATGVNQSAIGQGLIQAIQALGGNPNPAQAAILGGILAGIGQTDGMSPSQVAQVLSPLLQAANRPLTAANLLSTAAELQGTLTAFPGSQSAPILQLISSLGLSQALGSGPAGGFSSGATGIASVINAAAQTNSIFRNPSVLSGAASSITGGLQNAYSNPSQEAFFQMAGISYQTQRSGKLDPANVQSIMAAATRLYGSGQTRDIFLRSMFGLSGADLLETFAPGSAGARKLDYDLAHPGSTSAHSLAQALNNAQQRTTPNALASRNSAGILHWLFDGPAHAGIALGGAYAGKQLLGRGLRSLRGWMRGAGTDADGSAADGLGGDLADELGGEWADALTGLGGGPAGAIAGILGGALLNPDVAGPTGSKAGYQSAAARQVLQMAARKFGVKGATSTRARDWMMSQLYSSNKNTLSRLYGAAYDQYGLRAPDILRGGAGQALDNALGDQWATDPFTKLASSLDQLDRDIQKLLRPGGFTSYQPGSSSTQEASWLGTGGIQGLDAMGAGVTFAALQLGSGGGSASAFASYSMPSTGAAATGGGQRCTLTWYDPALGGTNSSSGAADPHSAMANGQPYEASAYTCAAPSQYSFGTRIQFTVGKKSIVCTVTDRGGAISGSHFDLTRGAFNALGSTSAGVLHGTFKVVSTGSSSAKSQSGTGSSGSGAGTTGGGLFESMTGSGARASSLLSSFASSGVGGGGTPIVVHNHINLDGHRYHQQRILLGHGS